MKNVRTAMTCLLVLLVSVPAQAQREMTFEPEEEMTFDPVDVSEPAEQPAEPAEPESGGDFLDRAMSESTPRGVVLVVRSGDAEPELAQLLTEALSKKVAATGKMEVMPAEDFQVRLFAPGERAVQDCATNAVCLSGYGKELWLDKIVMGVLFKGDGGYNLNVDLVGVDGAEVEQYANRNLPDLRSMSRSEIDKALEGMVFKLFDMRDPNLALEGPARRLVAKAGPVQKGLAWNAAGLAGAAVVTGLVFGAQARSIESELKSDDSMTQRAYFDRIDEGEGKELSAYIAFASAGVLLATSATLFLIKPLQEEEIKGRPATPGFNDEEASIKPFVLPGAASAEAGVTLGLRF